MKDENGGNSTPLTPLRQRTKKFALRVMRLYSALPNSTEGQIIGKQLLRCGTSVGAHYREAFRARSNAEFISKVEVALQELDEADYWMELLIDGKIIPERKLQALRSEVNELVAILVSAVKSAKRRS